MPEISLRHRQGHFTMEAKFSLGSGWTVLFGPSGAGKSTILRILAGLVVPDHGNIAIDGRTLLDTAQDINIPPARRSIGFVTQQPALFPHMTVSENVSFGLRHVDREARADRVQAMLRFFGAESLARRHPTQLSGGERQRVALARALAPQPKLLLLDEPLGALDGASSQDILSRLLGLDMRVLYVSHDLAEIWHIPAEVIFLEKGQMTASGPLRQILAPQRERLLQQLS